MGKCRHDVEGLHYELTLPCHVPGARKTILRFRAGLALVPPAITSSGTSTVSEKPRRIPDNCVFLFQAVCVFVVKNNIYMCVLLCWICRMHFARVSESKPRRDLDRLPSTTSSCLLFLESPLSRPSNRNGYKSPLSTDYREGLMAPAQYEKTWAMSIFRWDFLAFWLRGYAFAKF
jgi:hypothetical protein